MGFHMALPTIRTPTVWVRMLMWGFFQLLIVSISPDTFGGWSNNYRMGVFQMLDIGSSQDSFVLITP